MRAVTVGEGAACVGVYVAVEVEVTVSVGALVRVGLRVGVLV